MFNYRYIIFSLYLFLTQTLFSQGFITLDWEKPTPFYVGDELVETGLPGFAGAAYYADNHLPYYCYQMDLGSNYSDFDYEVKIEYPEFQELPTKYLETFIQKGIILPDYPQATTSIAVSAKEGILSVEFIPIVYREGSYQRINSFKLTIDKKEQTKTALTRATSKEERYTYNSVLSSGKWVKIRLKETGVYKITHTELRSMGFTDPSKVRLYGYGGNLLHEDFTKTKIDDLPEIPLWRENNYVLFYANGTIRWEKEGSWYAHTQNYFSSYAYYFLTEGEETPMEFPKQQSLSEAGATTVTTFDDYDLYEVEGYSWTEKGRKLYDTYDYKTGNTVSYRFNLPGITNDPGMIKLAFSASGSSTSSISLSVDGIEKGSSSLAAVTQYETVKETTREFTWNENKSETTSIILTHTRASAVSGRLDYLRLNFKRKLALYDAFTLFRLKTASTTKFVIDNATSTTCVWDVSDPADYKQIVGTYSNSQYTFVSDVPATNQYVVLDPSKTSFKTVEVVGTVENQNLHGLYGIDMVIIVPPVTGMITQAERLAQAHREKDDLTVQVITSEQIYNEFSSGTPDGTAYRWLMKMLYDRATEKEDAPRYLLLFGAGTSDNRMLTPHWKNKYDPKEFLLCFLAENSISDVSSYVLDDYYGFLDDEEGTNHTRDVVDIGIGRFPVRTVAEAKTTVDKMIAYMNNEYAGSWKNIVCTLGDDGTSSDGSGDNGPNVHMDQAEKIALDIENYSPELVVKRIHWDAYKVEKAATGNLYPDVTKQILEQLNDGTLYLNYTGHGGPSSLSHEKVFTTSHVSQIYSSKPAFWVTAACDVAPFDLSEESLGEALFLHATGGAIGLLSTTRTVYSNSNFTMNKAFVEHLFTKENNEYPRLGDAVRKAKAQLAGSSGTASTNNLHFVFLGNPALKLDYSEYKVVIEEFNGSKLSNNLPTISAGGVVNVKGYITDNTGSIVEDFDGVLYPTVLDTKETVTTYNNTGYVKDPFQYTSREKVLFNGSNLIESGRFDFNFPVPLDINYSGEDGLINFYAINEDKTKEGKDYFNDFLINDTDPNANLTDTEGPKIKLYLNSRDFVYGGKVNETPCLIAELEDEDGINTIGNGIGHDIIAIINNSENYTYVLNNYYKSYVGDYTRGTVQYTFPELPEGKHTLLFRAWDILNNSSTETLEFEVVKGLKPGLFDLDCTISPARETTKFILSHDRPGSELDIRISVYDFAGKELWTHTEKGVSSDNYYYIDWDLTTGGGQRLSPGVYLYRAAITSGGSKESTKARKIVVLAQ